MIRLRIEISIVLFALALASCGSDQTAPTSIAAGVEDTVIPTGASPFIVGSPNGPAVVTGCIWTNELGQVIGSWGKRQRGSGIAYPNPTSNYTVMTFALPIDAEVHWWLEKAYGPGEEIPNMSDQYVGATYYSPARVLYGPFSRHAAAGVQHLDWDGMDASGHPVSEGYYRMYIHVPRRGWTGWYDILIQHD